MLIMEQRHGQTGNTNRFELLLSEARRQGLPVLDEEAVAGVFEE
jgi:hypothetical protein